MSGLLCCIRPKPSTEVLPCRPVERIQSENSTNILVLEDVPPVIPHTAAITESANGTPNSLSGRSEAAREIKKIFAANEQTKSYAQVTTIGTTSEESLGTRSVTEKPSQKNSTTGLRSALRKRLSRSSEWSERSSRHSRKLNLSEETKERHRELKRALHQRLQSEIEDDEGHGHEEYDSDAEMIHTPKSGDIVSASRKSSSRQVDDKAQPSQNKVFSQGNDEATAQVHHHGNDPQLILATDDTSPPMDTLQQEEGKPRLRDTIALDNVSSMRGPRSDTALQLTPLQRYRIPSGYSERTKNKETALQAELPASEGPVTPIIIAQRLPSLGNYVPKNWKLSFNKSRRDSAVSLPESALSTGIPYVPSPQVSPPRGIQSATSLLIPPWYTLASSSDHEYGGKKNEECDPTREETNFGGVDGHLSSPTTRKGSTETSGEPVKSSNPSSVSNEHINAIVTPPRSQRKLLSTTTLLPVFQNPKHSLPGPVTEAPPRKCLDSFRHRFFSSGSPGGKTYSFENRASKISLDDCPEESFPTTRIPLPASIKSRKQLLSSVESDHAKRHGKDAAIKCSSTENFIAQELAAVERCTTPRSRASSEPKKSRFKEDLGDQPRQTVSLRKRQIRDRESKTIQLGEMHMLSERENERTIPTMDGSEQFASGRPGFGYKFSDNSENAGDMWERALQSHARETSAGVVTPSGFNRGRRSVSPVSLCIEPHKQRSCLRSSQLHVLSAPSKESKLSSGKSPDLCPLSMSSSTPDCNSPWIGNEGSWATYPSRAERIVTGNRASVSTANSDGAATIHKAMSEGTWARYPSITRAERSSSAVTSDRVSSYDFARDFESDRPVSVAQMERARGAALRDSAMRRFERFYLNQSKGHRSSVSPAGTVAYPELEILPNMEPARGGFFDAKEDEDIDRAGLEDLLAARPSDGLQNAEPVDSRVSGTKVKSAPAFSCSSEENPGPPPDGPGELLKSIDYEANVVHLHPDDALRPRLVRGSSKSDSIGEEHRSIVYDHVPVCQGEEAIGGGRMTYAEVVKL